MERFLGLNNHEHLYAAKAFLKSPVNPHRRFLKINLHMFSSVREFVNSSALHSCIERLKKYCISGLKCHCAVKLRRFIQNTKGMKKIVGSYLHPSYIGEDSPCYAKRKKTKKDRRKAVITYVIDIGQPSKQRIADTSRETFFERR